MNCYKSLVSSKFIANAPFEILRAKRILIDDIDMFGSSKVHTFDRQKNKITYYEVGNSLGFFSELYNLTIKPNRIYYLQYDRFMMVASNSKKLIDSAVLASFNVNGDFPLYRAIHVLNKVRVHTVLFNTNFIIPPSAVN